jgi:hypothetical protein
VILSTPITVQQFNERLGIGQTENWSSSASVGGPVIPALQVDTNRAVDILQGIVDRHTSRKNAMTLGVGESCACDDCASVHKVIKLLTANSQAKAVKV